MADLIDVANALVTRIAQAIYPNGTGQASAAGVPCKVFVGWPAPAQLDADMAAGKINVSVYALPSERNTSRYSEDWREVVAPVKTLTLTANGQAVTVGGTVSTPQVVALVIGGVGYPYAVQAGDTLTSIATGLAALVYVDYPGTTSTGPVVTLAGNANLEAARVGASGTSLRNLRQTEGAYQISIWAPTPANRDAVSRVVDIALAKTRFLTMPDGTASRLIYQRSGISDELQKTRIYRRDFTYTAEYSTTETRTDTQIILPSVNVEAGELTHQGDIQ